MNELEQIGREIPKKKKGILIVSILFVVFVLLGTVLYPIVVTKPKKVFTTAIDKVTSLAKQTTKEDLQLYGGSFSFQMDLTSNDKNAQKVLDILNQIQLGFTYKVDYEQEKMVIDLYTDYKKKDLLDLSIYFHNNDAYIFLQELYDKYIQVEAEGLEELFSSQDKMEEYQIVLEQVKNAFHKSLKDKYFTKEKTTLTIGNKDTKVTKNIFHLTEENLEEIVLAFSEELDNETFLTNYASLSGKSEDEIRDTLENLKNEPISLEEELEIILYTEGIKNDFVGIEFSDVSDTFTLLKESATNYSYKIKADRTSIMGTITLEKKDNDIKVVLTISNEELSGNISFSFTNEEDITIEDIDRNKVVAANAISVEDQEKILNALQEKDGIKELLQEFENLFNPRLYNTLNM